MTVGRPAVVFIGFMGAGKTTALAAAREAGLFATEIDALMEAEFGSTIPEAFERHGEEGFRAREEEIVGRLLEEADGGAIALGGGSILSEGVRTALGRHTVVWLQVDPERAWQRIRGTDRPLATSKGDVERLLAARLPLYEELADAVIPVGDRGIVARALPAIRELERLPGGTKLIWATSASGEYPVYVGHGLLAAVGREHRHDEAVIEDGLGGEWPLRGNRFLVTDAAVGAVYGGRLGELRGRAEVEPGEGSKTLAVAESVLREMARAGITREDHVLALGGGVVGDLAGLCAHLYQRGVPVVQLPTTVVAQVDSAYGGKTGVDLPEGKNYAGAYHQPAAVIADIETLATLPPAELAAGFVEALKTGLLAGGALWERVRAVERLDPAELDDVVFACARYKCEVVAADERDGGRRQALNLGHTVGHAIEAASGYARYRHGEAIGFGLLAALRLSAAPGLREETEIVLNRLGLPVRLDPAILTEEILEVLGRDKKRTAEGVGFVLLSVPGEPRVGQLLDPARVRAAVEELY